MKTTDEELFLRKMKRAQYVCAGAAVGIFALLLIYIGIGGAVSEVASGAVLCIAALLASSSATVASVIRFKDGRHFAYSTFLAWFFFSLIYTVYQHAVTFAVVVAVQAICAFTLIYGAYSSRQDKLTATKYIGVLIGIIIAFFSSYVGL